MWKISVLRVAEVLAIFALFDWTEAGQSCYRKLKDENIIPNFADRVGSTNLKVQYGKHVVECGGTFNLVDATNAPTITYDFKQPCDWVTVLGITADLPVPLYNPYILYLVHNVPAGLFKDGFKGKNQENALDQGSDVGDYGATWLTPKIVTGTTGTRNSTVFYFVYCQCHRIRPEKIRTYITDIDRLHFDIKGYAKEKQLGFPVSATFNFYLAAGAQLPKTVDLQSA